MSRNARLLSLLAVLGLVGSLVGVIGGMQTARANNSRSYSVDNTGDATLASVGGNACNKTAATDVADGDCSLRQAIELANGDSGSSTIDFSLLSSGDANYNSGYWTISPASPLPALTENGTRIIGLASNSIPLVIIDGSSIASGSAAGLTINGSSNSAIENLAVISMPGSTPITGVGIRITGAAASNNEILGSYLGVNPRTLVAAGNARAGIQIDGNAFQNRIGLRGSNASIVPNVIAGNNATGTTASGIYLQNSSETTIIGNFIGVIPSGVNSAVLSNSGNGIQIVDSNDNAIGGASSTTRNIISGNSQAGIRIEGTGSTGNTVYSNLIGVTKLGTAASPNGSDGIQVVNGAANTRLNGFRSGGGSLVPLVIAGNTGYGVFISDSPTSGTTVSQAYIGLSADGAARLANGAGGVRIQNDATTSQIGLPLNGTLEGGNIIAGNTGYGISIDRTVGSFTQTSGTQIRNNLIGLRSDGTSVISNTVGGIFIGPGALNTSVGGSAASDANIIAGNGPSSASSATGVVVSATGVVSATIAGNTIGLRRATVGGALTTAAGNQGGGILVGGGARKIQIGGTLAQANTIAFNQGNGVTVGSGTIGLQINSNSVLTNTLGGIVVTGVTTPTLIANTVRANQGGSGIQLTSAPRATVTGNTSRSNSQGGIALSGANGSTLTSNTIALNGGHGLQLSSTDVATISSNTTISNTLDGIHVDTSSTRITLSNNTATGNTQSGASITATSGVTVTINTFSRNTGGAGLILTGPSDNSRVTDNTIEQNGVTGVTILGPSATTNLTVTGNLIQKNTSSGILVSGNVSRALIQSNQVISNTLNGIQVGNGGSNPHPQRVAILGNTIARNGGAGLGTTFPITDPSKQVFGIVLSPKTSGTPGTATNPNHDIDPPIPSSLVVSQSASGTLTGRVLADSTNAACTTNPTTGCTIQLFNTTAATRDGQGSDQVSVPVTLTTNGYFTATLGFIPKQLALTATDTTGNTSEFAVFNATPSLALSVAQTLNAKPGDIVTLTHRITNTGNIAFTKLRVTASSNRSRWAVAPQPSTLFSLAPGQSRLVTVTLTLPSGADTQVRSGATGLVTTTLDSGSSGPDSINLAVGDSITILPRVVLSVSNGLNGSSLPNTTVTYPHTITNNGNITTTVDFVAATTVGGLPAPTWPTSFTPTTLTLAPGQSGATSVKVTVSSGAVAGPPPTVAQTTLTVTPSVSGVPDLTQVKIVTDTTTTTLQQVATLVPDRQGDAGATEVIQFRHVVTNNSNGTATFKLNGTSSQGSTITFSSNTPGIVLVNGNTFALPSTPGSNTFDFFVNVTVDRRLLPGQKDFVTVILTDANGGVIGNASVQDTITVTRGAIFPRLWLPLVLKP